MKIDEVAQDDNNIFEGSKCIQYAVDDNGKYVQVKSVGLEAQNIALDLAWDEVNEAISSALEEVKSNTKSPIYYFMKKEIMDISILAESVYLPMILVWLHLKPFFFNRISASNLEKYRIAFKLDSINDITNLLENQ